MMNSLIQTQALIEPMAPRLNYTPLDQDNWDFTNRAHAAAQDLLYPSLFGVTREQLEFETPQGQDAMLLDGQLGVDRRVKVRIDGFDFPLEFTIQERFREPEAARWRDVTITTVNLNTNLPSEFYKVNAAIFLYGYYDEQAGNFIEAIAFDCFACRWAIFKGLIEYNPDGYNPRSNQQFLKVLIDNLIKTGNVLRHWRNNVPNDTEGLQLIYQQGSLFE